ncbi:MAG: hypothetical protein ACREQN_07315 [Candidatus Binataceae bacterium]
MIELYAEWYRYGAGGAPEGYYQGAATAVSARANGGALIGAIAHPLGAADKIVQSIWNPK